MCDESYKTSLATTIYFVGVTLGGAIFGTLSDKFGRRPIFIITLCSTPVIGVALFFAKNYIAFVMLRLGLGAFIQVRFLFTLCYDFYSDFLIFLFDGCKEANGLSGKN